MIDHYILDGHDLVPIIVWKDGVIDREALYRWGKWYEENDRTVMLTELVDGSRISTIFLGIDHSYLGGPPHLFETALLTTGDEEFNAILGRMVSNCEVVARYATWAEAEVGHMEWIERCVAPDLIATLRVPTQGDAS